MKAILIGGAALLAAGAVALALSQDGRAQAPQAPEVVPQQAPEAPPVAELADPGTIVEEPEPAPVLVVDTGYQVDADGFVWEPLSYDKPQIKGNGDGTVTMKKLARIVEADGSMREVPITVTASPQQRRMPIKARTMPATPQQPEPAAEPSQDGE
jgi:hypothetical protein